MWSVIKSIDRTILSSREIGIFISGGFDSTVLAAYVFKYISENRIDRNVVLYTVPRFDDSRVHADRVIEWLSTNWPSVSFRKETVGDPTEQHQRQVLSGIMMALSNTDVTIMLGDTKIPDEEIDGEAPNRVRSTGPRVVQPFFDYDKTVTLRLAMWLELLDDISHISHTCTESRTLRCNKCWQCRERNWAFTKLLLIDEGTM